MIDASTDARHGWVLTLGRVDFERALEWQKGLHRMRRDGFARDTIILVEHDPVVTVGRDGHPENFKHLKIDPVKIERGGDVTYHGPGQLVAYFIFNLTRRGRDLHRFMQELQSGIIATLSDYDVIAKPGDEHTGVWVGEKKIASLGIAVKNWITFHGIAVNLQTDLNAFKQINPCGLDASVMTSLVNESKQIVSTEEFGSKLVAHYAKLFDTEFAPITLEELAEDIESQSGNFEV
ncbi:MAG: lipoyl(octanoyl) transferase LipB [candidate division Zixibacteria bacterium]